MPLFDNIAIIILQMISCREVLYSTKTYKVRIDQHCEDSIFRLLKIYGLNARKILRPVPFVVQVMSDTNKQDCIQNKIVPK